MWLAGSGWEAPASCLQMRHDSEAQRFATAERVSFEERQLPRDIHHFHGTTGEEGVLQCHKERVWARRRSRETPYFGLSFYKEITVFKISFLKK